MSLWGVCIVLVFDLAAAAMVGRSKLLHLEWINNKVLIYSTENYIQYTVINHNGKEYRKRMYVISESVVSHSVVFDSLQLHGL